MQEGGWQTFAGSDLAGKTMGMLGLGKIPYERWVRFILPLLFKLYLVAIAALLFAVSIDYA